MNLKNREVSICQKKKEEPFQVAIVARAGTAVVLLLHDHAAVKAVKAAEATAAGEQHSAAAIVAPVVAPVVAPTKAV
jgi:hypothetical protein